MTPVVLYLSPDDSNSMSSPVQAREAVLGDFGTLGGVPIRTYEFMNYYTFDYPVAEAGKLTLTTELIEVENGADRAEYILQIGVASEAMTNEDRPLLNITLVLDESGSMAGAPMEMQRESCRAIAASLKEGDILSAVGWDVKNALKLGGYVVQGPNDPQVLDVCNGLTPGGGTNLAGGLTAGYELAAASYDSGRINRIVLISDGGANTGVTDETLIAEQAGGNNQDGIYMVGVGVGTATSYNDLLMDTVTDLGKGASVFIPNEEEAWKIFGDQFVNTLAVTARDVQVELELPPGFEIVKFSGEEFNTDPSKVEPQHLAPNDAMIFYQQIETCAPELVQTDTPITVTVRYKDAITFEERQFEQQITFGDLMGEGSKNLLKGAAVYTYAEALKAQKDFGVDPSEALSEAFTALEAAEAALPGDAELSEIRSVLENI
jgi:Ca-activated chloride channel family protein